MSYRVGVLGAGYFAQFHIEGWQRIEGATLVAVCDRDRVKADAAGVAAFTDLDAMLETARPDILDIATPPPTHAEAIRAGLAAGVAAIICQKPFCSSLEEARAVTAEAEAAGIPLVVHENFRFQPWYRKAREAIEEGRLGTVWNMTFRLRTGDGQGPEAYLARQPYFQKMERFLIHETAVHWIDTFQFLLGPIESVYADLRRLNPNIAGEDAGIVIFEHSGGARSVFDGNRLLDHAAHNLRLTLGEALIEGEKGAMILDGNGLLTLRPFLSLERENLLDVVCWPGFAGDCVARLSTHVVAALNGRTAFENTARVYLRVRAIEEAVYDSAQHARRVRIEDDDDERPKTLP